MSETLQGPDFSPLYRQVKELLLQRIAAGHWKPGDILPSETKLAGEFNVSQGTVRKALEELAAEHLVVRHQGKGTFVTARGAEQPVHFFSMMTADHQRLPPRFNGKVTHEVGLATPAERRSLGLPEGADVVRIFRVRLVGGTPSMFDEIILARAQFPGFEQHLNRDDQVNTYVIMEKEYGVLAVRSEEWLSAVPAEPRHAEVLNVEVGQPMLKIDRVTYGVDGKPIELRTVWVDTTDCHYYNSVS
ncbi:MAG: GntR family transcriptional regulator [Alphaproteobacteria bacterium]|nr:GntR family transcriptional regulator [Alphaproteobacteria bacterium]